MKIVITHEVSLHEISNLICSAIEGGSNYWYRIDQFIEPKKIEFRSMEDKVYRHLDYPLNEGGALIFSVPEDEDGKTYRLDLAVIETGLQLMAEKHSSDFGDFVSGNYDANTGDTFLQLCLFGEIVYG